VALSISLGGELARATQGVAIEQTDIEVDVE
jgi:hypothetical protein